MVAELLDKKQLFPDLIPPSKTAFVAARLKILIPFFIDLFLPLKYWNFILISPFLLPFTPDLKVTKRGMK